VAVCSEWRCKYTNLLAGGQFTGVTNETLNVANLTLPMPEATFWWLPFSRSVTARPLY